MVLRTIEYDDADSASINSAINKLRSVQGSLRKVHGITTSSERTQKQYDAAKAIIETRTAYLYGNYVQRRSRGCYVYMHCQPDRKLRKGSSGVINYLIDSGVEYMPFYVGKGVGSRDTDLDRNETHRKVRQRLQTFGKDIVVKRIAEDLSEKDALALESRWIDVLGLRVNGGMFLKQVTEFVSSAVKGEDVERCIIVTDEQDTDVDGTTAKATLVGKHNYVVNIATDERGIGYGRFTHINGWSEAVLKFIAAYEANEAELHNASS